MPVIYVNIQIFRSFKLLLNSHPTTTKFNSTSSCLRKTRAIPIISINTLVIDFSVISPNSKPTRLNDSYLYLPPSINAPWYRFLIFYRKNLKHQLLLLSRDGPPHDLLNLNDLTKSRTVPFTVFILSWFLGNCIIDQLKQLPRKHNEWMAITTISNTDNLRNCMFITTSNRLFKYKNSKV